MSLIAWYPLINDLTNNGIGSVATSGAPTFSTGGKIGNCMTGNDITFTIPSIANSKVWSICFWGYVVSSQITSNWTLLVRVRDNGSHFRFEACPSSYANGIYCYSTHNNASYAICKGGMSAPTGGFYDQWCHVCVTSDGTTIRGYYNGQLRSTWAYDGTGAITGVFDLTNNAKCKKNDLRIYDHCLSPKEVEILARGLVLHYPMTGGGRGQPNLYNFESVTSKWKTKSEGLIFVDATDDVYGNVLKITSPSSVSSERIYRGVKDVWKADTNFTVSFLAKASKTAVLKIERSQTDYAPDVTVGTTWKRYSTVISCTATTTGGALGIQPSTASADIYLTQIKVELGDKATAYCPGVGDSHYIPMGYNDNIEYDVSGNKYHATITGTVERNSNTARYSTCTGFSNNTYESVSITPGDMASRFTFVWWARYTLYSAHMFWGFANGNRLNLFMNNTFCWNTGDGANNTFGVSASTYADNNWHHFAVTGDGTTVKLYIDGEFKANAKTFKGVTGTTLIFNGWDTSNSYNFNGNLSDFRLYATCLSTEDIQKLYNTALSLSNNGTLLGYEFVEN